MGKRLNGLLIKAIRKKSGLRQVDLAALSGLSEESVRLAERGRPIGIDVHTRLAKALRVDPADQLFAEKGLRLDQVRRLDEDGEALGQSASGQRRRVVEERVTRVRLDLNGRRALRHYLLTKLTPVSAFTLDPRGICCHEEVIDGWTQAAYEGFLAACIFYLENGTFAYQEGACGNFYTYLKSVLMGRHGKIVFATGDEDDAGFPRNRKLEENIERMWDESEIGPAGDLRDDLYRYCPTLEPNSYYRGWLECCYWLTGNAELNLRHKIDKLVPFYLRLVLDMVRSYIDRFENASTPGTLYFWAVVQHHLHRAFGESRFEMDEREFGKGREHSFEDLLIHVGRSVELSETALDSYRDLVDSYPDRETGYQAAILKLQSQFMYTGKKSGDQFPMNAARIPHR
jgi:transcriptional regulator with XRE-family HTH domain